MSVSETIALPAQPSTGRTALIPLGGDGFEAPISYTALEAQLTGDASGGNATIKVEIDDRYTQLLAYAVLSHDQSSAVAYRVDFQCTTEDQLIESGEIQGYASGTTGRIGNYIWEPPAALCAAAPGGQRPNLRYQAANVNGAQYVLNCKFLNFDRRAREEVPLYVLLANINR